MPHEIHADFTQQFLLPPSLEDWLPADHPARFLRDFVEQLNLTELGFAQRQTEEGRPNYSSKLLLTAWLYGYLEKVRSSRKLEHACKTHLPLIWLLGMNSPDHNSLWRFWRAHRKQIAGVFKQSVLVAQQLDLVGMVLHALDGTKVTVCSSPRQAIHRADLAKLLAALEESIREMESCLQSQAGEPLGEMALPASLQQAQQRKEAIEGAIRNLEECQKQHLLPEEPEASMMMQSNGRIGWNYNAQAVVDASNGIVVAQEVTNEVMDYQQLAPMLEQSKETLGATAQTSVADAGYCSAQQQVQAAESGHTVILPSRQRPAENGPYPKSDFFYKEETDQYLCPQGKPLRYTHTLPPRDSRLAARVYRCRECKDCPVRSRCTTSRTGRTINRDASDAIREQQRQQLGEARIRQVINQRKAIVEPLFGNIKENQNFRRWSSRGLENAKAQWAMLCLTVNIKKLIRHWQMSQTSVVT